MLTKSGENVAQWFLSWEDWINNIDTDIILFLFALIRKSYYVGSCCDLRVFVFCVLNFLFLEPRTIIFIKFPKCYSFLGA